MSRTRTGRRGGRVAAGLLLAVAALFAGPPSPARADDSTAITSVPADGAAVREAPRTVVLTFARTPQPAQSHVRVSVGTTALEHGEPRLSSAHSLTVDIGPAPVGVALVAYHVVFDDGTETVGSYRFSVGTMVPPPAVDQAARRVAAEDALGHDHGVDPFGATLLLVDLAVLVVVAALLRRPRRGPGAPRRAWRLPQEAFGTDDSAPGPIR